MQLELHKAYRLYNGDKAVAVDYLDLEGGIFKLFNVAEEDWHYYLPDGAYEGDRPNPLSVKEEWSEPKRGTLWLNVYEGYRAVYSSKDAANKAAYKGRLACVEVKWTEGEGL